MMQATLPQAADHAKNPYDRALRGLRPIFVMVLGFSAVINVLMLTGSVYMLQVYDRVLSSGSLPTLFALFGIVVILFGFLAIYDFLRARMLSRVALRLDQSSSEASFDLWLRSGLPENSGDGHSQPLRDLETLRSVVSSSATTAVFDLPFVPLFVAVLFLIHPWLGLLTVAGAVIVGLFALLNRWITQKAIGKSAAVRGAETRFEEATRRNADAVIAMGMTGAVLAHWSRLHTATLANSQSGSDPSQAIASVSRAFRMLLQSAILTLGALLVLRGDITAGMIIASSILSGRALAPIDQLIGQWRTIGRGLAAHGRLKAQFDARTEAGAPIDLPLPTGDIRVTGLVKLGAQMPGSDRKRILSDVSFSLSPGDGLGVIGNSASGKSTLARMLVGAGAPDFGEIRLDGATLDQWDPARLGSVIGYLPQNVEMLPGTIRENIARFAADAKDADVIAAAKLTGIHDMILNLPQGYTTQLAVPGQPSPLSGGQIQRLGLARAVYKMPKLVVLDEPNSNLDVAGDEALTHTLMTLLKNKSTVIVMAHRPSALAALNKLMVLDAGTVKLIDDKEKVLGQSAPAKPATRTSSQPKVVATAPAPMSSHSDNDVDEPHNRRSPHDQITPKAVGDTATAAEKGFFQQSKAIAQRKAELRYAAAKKNSQTS